MALLPHTQSTYYYLRLLPCLPKTDLWMTTGYSLIICPLTACSDCKTQTASMSSFDFATETPHRGCFAVAMAVTSFKIITVLLVLTVGNSKADSEVVSAARSSKT